MATRSKPNWKVLDRLLTVLEKEGWSHAQIAEDWGMSLVTLEGHLNQEVSMSAPPKHDYPALTKEYEERLASGESRRAIEAEFQSRGIHVRTFLNQRSQIKKPQRDTPVQTPVQPMSTGAEQSVDTGVDTGADELFGEHNIEVQRPVQTPVYDSTPSLDTSAENSADDSADESQVLFLPHEPVQTAVQRLDTGPVQTLDTGAVQRLNQLEEEVHSLAHVVRSLVDRLNHTPVQTPVQITTTPPYPKGKSVRWNLWILEPIRDELATLAAERDVSPSQLVQEMLWTALHRE